MARQQTLTLFDFTVKKNSDEKKEEAKKGEDNKQEETVEKQNEGQLVVKKEWLEEAPDGKIYYLLSVDYDGKKGKAFMKLYDPEAQKMYVLYDKTNHKPYFLVDLEPDKVSRIPKIVRDPSFDGLEVVTKIDPYSGNKIKLTKAIVKDPLAVRRMRNSVPKAYEAHIKYFNNYIYDLGLIPGMPYKVEGGKLVPVTPKLNESEIEEVKKAFADADDLTRTMATEWLPFLEAEAPSVKRVAFDIEVFTPSRGRIPDPEKAEYPIISIALAGSDGLREVLILRRDDVEHGKAFKDNKNLNNVTVEEFKSEYDILKRFLQIILNYPVILTFNGDDFDVPYIYFRALRLGFSPDELPFEIKYRETKYLAGIHIDLYKFFFNRAVRNYAFEGKYSEYNLDSVTSALLGVSKIKIDTIVTFLTEEKLAEYNYRDAELTLDLTTFEKELTWKLVILFARMSRMGIEELTRTEISTWIKNLYYWEHRRRGLLIPLKEEILARAAQTKSSAIIKGKGYKGAVVIDPPAGIFFNIVVLDFASLYPSVIRNWNLSYETVDYEGCVKKEEIRDETGEVLHFVCMDKPGITAVITGLLRDFRVKIYKKKAKKADINPDLKAYYDVVQRAMKVFINATYGVFGAENFPLYAPAMAESVTALGRFVITNTVKKAGEMGLRVLYGDTDSLFLYNPPKEKLDEVISWVKKTFKLDLEIDKVYKLVAFSGLKKNYLGVYPDGKVELKGMLAKKRNTPEFVKKEFEEIKSLVVSMDSPDDVSKIKEKLMYKIKDIYNKLKNKGYNLDELAFKIMLSKALEEYKKTTPQHVKAAIQLQAYGIHVMPRDVIMFVKVKSKDGVKPVQLAKLSEIDTEKYIETVRSTFEQILKAFGINWDEISSVVSIDSFFK